MIRDDTMIFYFLIRIFTAAFAHMLWLVRLHLQARSQFPGPPVQSFWTGNLDQTMADNVHEKVGGRLLETTNLQHLV